MDADRFADRVQVVASVILVFIVVMMMALTSRTLARVETLSEQSNRQAELNETILREMRGAITAGNEGQADVIEALLAEIRVIACEEARASAGLPTGKCERD